MRVHIFLDPVFRRCFLTHSFLFRSGIATFWISCQWEGHHQRQPFRRKGCVQTATWWTSVRRDSNSPQPLTTRCRWWGVRGHVLRQKPSCEGACCSPIPSQLLERSLTKFPSHLGIVRGVWGGVGVTRIFSQLLTPSCNTHNPNKVFKFNKCDAADSMIARNWFLSEDEVSFAWPPSGVVSMSYLFCASGRSATWLHNCKQELCQQLAANKHHMSMLSRRELQDKPTTNTTHGAFVHNFQGLSSMTEANLNHLGQRGQQ